ncbi:MAG: hypothetical protein ACXVH3_02910 [Solirubrobacteraceae bacterium]
MSSELKPRWAEEEIVNLLSRLDGVDRYSMILWELPENTPFDLVDINDYPHEYVQCAGSFEGRLTAEVREVRDGLARQYVIGRVSDDPGDSGGADEVVPWNGYEARVRANEVLTGSDVQELFLFYYRTGELPGPYTGREIEL